MSFCTERCPSGRYAGYACCSEPDHLGDHTVTEGKPEGGSVVVHTWPAVRRPDGTVSTLSQEAEDAIAEAKRLDLGHCHICGAPKAVTLFMGVPHCNGCAP
jgi:hypothetical protein